MGGDVAVFIQFDEQYLCVAATQLAMRLLGLLCCGGGGAGVNLHMHRQPWTRLQRLCTPQYVILFQVAGGDGTVGWCLSSVGALREISATTSIPPLGIIPLGTGNDLSRSFGWGGEFTSTAKSSLKKCLVKALNSKAAPLDTWKTVVMPAKSVAAEDIQFPHSMHPQHHVPLPSSVAGEKHDKDETAPAFEGLFFNYFSVGMDAQVAYGFHHLRDEKPWLARSRKANEMIYSTFGCTQGWFCTACSMAPRARLNGTYPPLTALH
ncbi:hypothetical protein M758_11G158500 [Ceratodon purpureus]|nr:hypothetical protein M758_11G158500 [Ceratodon purpureus]